MKHYRINSLIKKILLNTLVFLTPKNYREKLKKRIFLGNSNYCPICESHIKKFYPYYFPKPIKIGPRANAVCPVCGSIERHRLLWLYLQECTNLFKSPLKKMLHVAPESVLTDRLKKCEYIDYLSSDLDPTRAMIKMDLTNILMPDNSFDAIVCIHVLEHILDHKKALKELRRILKPGGWAIIQVPILGETTFEDPSVKTDVDKERVYGFSEHVRGYGKDFKNLLEEAGFKVKVDDFARKLGKEKVKYMGLLEYEDIYFCKK